MKYFAWIESAVQAITNDSKGSQRRDDNKDARSSSSSQSIKDEEVQIKQTEEPLPDVAYLDTFPILETAIPSTNLEILNHVEPVSNSSMLGPGQRAAILPISTDTPIRSSRNESSTAYGAISNAKEIPEEASLAFDYNPAITDYISSGRVQNPRSLRRRNQSSTSTIFQNSPLTPITIIVTTPDEQTPSPQSHNPFNAIRAHRQSTSLPSSRLTSLATPNLIPDSNRLKPPTEQQINASKLTKAHEIREIRKFLISFLNAKGDQFPKKLRCRIMDMYCITVADLLPEVVAKFTDEIRDEGVALEQLGISESEATDLDDLHILQMAFMSQLPVLSPRKEPVSEESKPSTRPRKQSLIGRRAEARRDEVPLSWLSLTTNALAAAPPLDSPPPRPAAADHKLLRASSAPNLRIVQETEMDVPPVPSIPSTYADTPLPLKTRSRNNTLSTSSDPKGMEPIDERLGLGLGLKDKDKEGRNKNSKGNAFLGVFGAVRDAIAASKEARAREKRRVLRDAIL